MRLSIEKSVAFVVVHDRRDGPPGLTLVVSAESVQVGAFGGGGGATVTVAVHEPWPPGPDMFNV